MDACWSNERCFQRELQMFEREKREKLNKWKKTHSTPLYWESVVSVFGEECRHIISVQIEMLLLSALIAQLGLSLNLWHENIYRIYGFNDPTPQITSYLLSVSLQLLRAFPSWPEHIWVVTHKKIGWDWGLSKPRGRRQEMGGERYRFYSLLSFLITRVDWLHSVSEHHGTWSQEKCKASGVLLKKVCLGGLNLLVVTMWMHTVQFWFCASGFLRRFS